jgi:hypothetical protein
MQFYLRWTSSNPGYGAVDSQGRDMENVHSHLGLQGAALHFNIKAA